MLDYLPGSMIHNGTTDRRQCEGLPLEWLWIPPDNHVEQTPQDVQSGSDLELEAAIDLLKQMN